MIERLLLRRLARHISGLYLLVSFLGVVCLLIGLANVVNAWPKLGTMDALLPLFIGAINLYAAWECFRGTLAHLGRQRVLRDQGRI